MATTKKKVTAYLSRKVELLFTAYVDSNEVTESAAINDILRHYFTTIPQREMMSHISKAHNKPHYE